LSKGIACYRSVLVMPINQAKLVQVCIYAQIIPSLPLKMKAE
jgi:predicted aminopeptidase